MTIRWGHIPRADVIDHGGRPRGRRPNLNELKDGPLTKQENRLMDLLIDECMSNAEIGIALDISEETVKRHLSNIFDKTGYSNRTELAIRTLQKRQAGSGHCSCNRVRALYPEAFEHTIASTNITPAEYHIYDRRNPNHCLARSTKSMEHAWYLACLMIEAQESLQEKNL